MVAQDAQDTDARAEIVGAARVLAALELVTAFGHVSARVGDRMLVTPAAALAGVRAADLVSVPLDLPSAAALPPGAPAESWIHLRTYAARPDVSAIARAQPPDAFAAAAVASVSEATGLTGLRPLHGQASWLGRVVPVHDDARLLRTADLADAAAATLGAGDALLLRGNGAVTTAAGSPQDAPGLAVARMWLLAAACRTYLAASAAAAGHVKALSDAEVDSWRAVQGELLPRLWRHLRDSAQVGHATPSVPTVPEALRD